MTTNCFAKSSLIGKVWEKSLEDWLAKRFLNTTWIVDDTRDFYRDNDGDQVPDYIIYNTKNEKFHFIDAKKRNVYNIKNKFYFGFDEKYLTSYRNIAKKFETNVYVGFNDPIFDPDHVYILNVDQQPELKLHFKNLYGNSFAYRWKIEELKKFKL